ncbi:unnamed protein product [Anisakis simplex]|uniref:Uncharacterized protein n=1 Tax=Anisakis simplex TaxID=6269 RepID=A0A0M3JYH4_ANISI|nr:unnamed protein product [Anisakis simplex]
MASSAIRSSIGPCKKRLADFLQTGLTTIDLSEMQNSPNPESALRVAYMNVDHALRRLQQYITTLQAKNTEWITLISRLKDQQAADEEAIKYELHVSDPDNFLEVIEIAKDHEVTLESQLKNITALLAQRDTCQPTSSKAPTPLVQPQNLPMRLPQLQIKTFDGEARKWPQFWPMFLSAIDTQPLTKVEKLMYLLPYLEGKALHAVSGFTVSENNYDTVKEVLIKKFGNTATIVKQLYFELQNWKPTGQQFPEMIANTECVLQQLTQLGENINNAQTELCIENRLPPWARLEIEQAKEETETWSVIMLRNKLAAMVRVRENAQVHPLNKFWVRT